MSLPSTTLPSTSLSPINTLDDNLLIEILSRIPCKSALCCTAVCKRWQTLISTPYFSHHSTIHHQNSPKTSTMVFRYDYFHCYMQQETDNAGYYKRTLSISNHPVIKSRGCNLLEFNVGFPYVNFGWTSLVAGCDDLLVLRDDDAFPSVYFVVNPLTRKWVKLPPAEKFHTEDRTAVGMVIYRGSREEGSGYRCDALYRYRIVCITELAGTHFPVKINVEIFSSDTGEWTNKYMEIPTSGGFGGSRSRVTVIPFSQNLHWFRGQTIVIIDPFDDTASQCLTINPPTGITSRIPFNCLGVCNGRLHVSRVTREEAASKLMVWELVDHCNTREWQLKYGVFLKDMVFVHEDSFRRLTFSSEVVAFHPIDEDVVYLKDRDQLVRCDMKSRMLEVVNEGVVEPSIHIRRILVFPLVHPWWPTSVLPLPAPASN